MSRYERSVCRRSIRLVLLPLLLSVTTSAAAGAVTIDRVEIGLSGLLKVGCWSEVAVDVTTDVPRQIRLTIEAPDPEGNVVSYATAPIDLPSPGSHQLSRLFKVGRMQGTVQVRVRDESGELASYPLSLIEDSTQGNMPEQTALEDSVQGSVLKQTVFLVATVGGPAGFENPFSEEETHEGDPQPVEGSSGRVYRVARLEKLAELPADVAALESLDALVIAGDYAIDDDRSRVLRDWVTSGGHLIVSVGSNVAGYKSSPIATWMPVPVLDQRQIRDRELRGFESFSGKNRRIHFVGWQAPAAKIGPVDGKTIVSGLTSEPLLVRVPFGLGLVTLFALDLERPPLSTWRTLSSVTRKILSAGGMEASANRRGKQSQLTHTGITELASQLHRAQQQFPQVSRLSTWTIMGLLFVYLLVIGPVDYFLVHRVLKRPRLTWVTFPTMVVLAASLGAYGATATNGSALEISQIDVLDVDAQSQTVRTQSWATIYSPQTRRYQVSLRTPEVLAGPDAAIPLARPRLSWHGVAESVYGGMYRPAGFEVVRHGYVLKPESASIADLPIPIWSTKSLVASRMDRLGTLAESGLESTALGQLFGTVSHHLPVPIETPILAYGSQVYQASGGSGPTLLRPGEKWHVAGLSRRDLNGFLTDARSRRVKTEQDTFERIVIEKTRYDQQSLDPTDIMRMITFHQAAGGDEYTGLVNNAMRELDLTRLLRAGRAVLFGTVALNCAPLELDGQITEPSRHAAFVRIILPVKITGSVATELPPFKMERSSELPPFKMERSSDERDGR